MSSLALTRLNKVSKTTATVFVTGFNNNLTKSLPMKVEDDHDHVHLAVPTSVHASTNNGMKKLLIKGNAKAQTGLFSKCFALY